VAAFLVDPRSPEMADFSAHYPTCRDCARAVAGWSRFEEALQSLGADDTRHPEASELLAFERRGGALDAQRREAVATHVAGCGACRSELAALRGFDFAALRSSPHGSAPAAPHRASPSPRRRQRLLAAAAVAALALLSLPLLLGEEDVEPGEAPAVAQREPTERTPAPAVALHEETPPDSLPAPAVPQPAEPAPSLAEGPAPALAEKPAPAASRAEPDAAPDREASGIASEPAPALAEPVPVEAPFVVAMVFPTVPLSYAAPGPGDPALLALRQATVVRGSEGPVARIQALAPTHVGLTTQASPTLYWTSSRDTNLRVELVLTDEQAEEPLVDRALEGAARGTHALSLTDLGVALQPGVTYRWYASLVPDPADRSSEVVSGGAVRRVVPGAALEAALSESEPGRRAHAQAEAGLFYDSLETLSRWVVAFPEAPEPRRYRDALLEAVELEAPPERP
jgi:hypothetical protein